MIIVRNDVEEKVKLKSKKVRTATNDLFFINSSADYFQLIILSIKYQINVNKAHHSFPGPTLPSSNSPETLYLLSRITEKSSKASEIAYRSSKTVDD